MSNANWFAALGWLLGTMPTHADVVTDWNIVAGEVVTAADLGTPPANRVMAIAHTSAFYAANAIGKEFPVSGPDIVAPAGASIDAAIAAAHRTVLKALVPTQHARVDTAFQRWSTAIERDAWDRGVRVGEQAAAAVMAERSQDGSATVESYRPRTAPGVYVPTVLPAVPQWPLRRPWLLKSADELRPPAPPPLTSERWSRDYNEIKAVGARQSAIRTAEQTAMARFWEATLPPIYHGVVRSVANMSGRTVIQNARLFAAATQAADDGLIAVFDAKYAYEFWRPITAIRNGDQDGNDATERDAGWTPFINTPLHPEYPCAHCVVAAAMGAVLKAEIGSEPTPILATTSSTAGGVTRQWSTIEAFVDEVANARIFDGVHYRFSTEVGVAMGEEVGKRAVARHMRRQ